MTLKQDTLTQIMASLKQGEDDRSVVELNSNDGSSSESSKRRKLCGEEKSDDDDDDDEVNSFEGPSNFEYSCVVKQGFEPFVPCLPGYITYLTDPSFVDRYNKYLLGATQAWRDGMVSILERECLKKFYPEEAFVEQRNFCDTIVRLLTMIGDKVKEIPIGLIHPSHLPTFVRACDPTLSSDPDILHFLEHVANCNKFTLKLKNYIIYNNFHIVTVWDDEDGDGIGYGKEEVDNLY